MPAQAFSIKKNVGKLRGRTRKTGKALHHERIAYWGLLAPSKLGPFEKTVPAKGPSAGGTFGGDEFNDRLGAPQAFARRKQMTPRRKRFFGPQNKAWTKRKGDTFAATSRSPANPTQRGGKITRPIFPQKKRKNGEKRGWVAQGGEKRGTQGASPPSIN